MAIVGKKCNVIMQLPDGEIYDLTGMVENIQVTQDVEISGYHGFGSEYRRHIPTEQRFTMDLSIVGNTFTRSTADVFLNSKTTNDEWKCPFCGHINPLAARNCGAEDQHAFGCGGSRPFYLQNGERNYD